MQGNCEVEPEALGLQGAPMLPLKKGQCVLVADGNVLGASSGSLWLQGLYIRLHRMTGGTFKYFIGALCAVLRSYVCSGVTWQCGSDAARCNFQACERWLVRLRMLAGCAHTCCSMMITELLWRRVVTRACRAVRCFSGLCAALDTCMLVSLLQAG